MYNRIKHIHLIGIGGIGMSGLGHLLVRNGYQVTGSDLGRGEAVRALEAQGVKVFQGHDPLHIKDAELVVYSSAVKAENPELSAARAKEVLCITRGEMLAELMRLKYGIAVAGAHGKTTTTSMTGVILAHADLDPTVVVGGRVDNFGGTNARLGQGEFMVAEADESDGSFNRLSPSIAIVTNLDREHLDHYGSMENLEAAFVTFANKVPFYGLTVFCADDPQLDRIHSRITRRKRSYGFGSQCNYRIEDYAATAEGSAFFVNDGSHRTRLELQVPGKHNALNAVAAFAVADELGVAREITQAALKNFRGVARRFQFRGEQAGVRFFDDYAHHPTEIRATLAAARERFPGQSIRVVFQPHRYTRFSDLWKEFSACFAECDHIAVTPVYSAGEKPMKGVSAEQFAHVLHAQQKHSAEAHGTALDAVHSCLKRSEPGDVILTLGAGDLPNVYQNFF
jgi:UDP-N-acetylmuramate--alanine ligase